MSVFTITYFEPYTESGLFDWQCVPSTTNIRAHCKRCAEGWWNIHNRDTKIVSVERAQS